jgi:glutaredoxin 3
MLTLYFSPTCPFCQRVLQIADNLNIELETKDVNDSEIYLAELVELSGKTQTPYLVDSDKGVKMNESSDIIDYLRENYAKSKIESPVAVKPRIHVGGSVCESCEG